MNSIRKDADRVLKRQGFNPSSWAFARGTLAYLDRDWAKAYRIWSERHTLEPANVPLANATARAENNFKHMMVTEQEDFFRRSARAFYEQGLYSQAMTSWVKVLELRTDDVEAMQGKAVAEEASLRIAGKNKTSEVQALLEEGLDYYANQRWTQALETFKKINEMDSTFIAATDYIEKINGTLAAQPYSPAGNGGNQIWRPTQPSSPANVASVVLPAGTDNFTERRSALESQQKRDPSNIKIQQELDKVVKMQEEESERVYKDGLIAYSQGNRSSAIEKWKQVLIINPDHKKAEAALKKARAEEDRSVKEESSSQ
jgi:tetratricopeptide (TPR) repeat protein